MKTYLKLIIGVIAVSCFIGLFSDENKPMDGLIRIGDLLWDIKKNRSGLDWDSATKYCAEKGMRLPSKEELLTHQDELLKLEENKEIGKHGDSNSQHTIILYLYWSSTEYEKDILGAWTVYIRQASVDARNKSEPIRKSSRHSNVRCVKNAEKK